MRGRRVAETVKHHLTQAFVRELGDRRFENVVITEVAVPEDLGTAWVSVRLLVGDDDERQRKAALKLLGHVAARLRRSLAPKLGLKRVPELRFTYDTGLDHARRVDEILREIAAEAAPPEVASDETEPQEAASSETASSETASSEMGQSDPDAGSSEPTR